MKENYDPVLDVFRCSYCGAALNEVDNKDPLFLCFDHRTPKKRNDIVVCGSVFNCMNSDMTAVEFPTVVIMLAHHFLYRTPFDRDAVKFLYWHRVARVWRPAKKRGLRRWKTRHCLICGKEPVPATRYCARCHRYADAPDFSKAQLKALIEAIDPVLDRFICHYTGVPLDEADPGSPWYINYDHVIPGDGSRLVVAANFVNVMKSEMSEEEFRAVIIELARHLETGEPFNTDVLKLKYWTVLSRMAH